MTVASEQCEFVFYVGSFAYAPEQCEEDAVEGSRFCSRHVDDFWWDPEDV